MREEVYVWVKRRTNEKEKQLRREGKTWVKGSEG